MKNGIPMLAPTWTQIPIGPLLRWESDFRFYHNLFKKHPKDVRGWRRFWLRIMAREKTEPEDFSCMKPPETFRDIIILFKGQGDLFFRLNGWDQFLYKEIRAVTRDRWLQRADEVQEVPIGIHIRRGDFREPDSPKDFYTTGSLKIPLSWFVESLRVIREFLGFPARAFLASDGTEDELGPLLAEENVVPVKIGSAIGDLLVLSKAKVLIASGSSFSAWASFFGQMPTITHPGQSLTWVKLINRKGYYVGEFNPSSPPQLFMDQVKAILGHFRA